VGWAFFKKDRVLWTLALYASLRAKISRLRLTYRDRELLQALQQASGRRTGSADKDRPATVEPRRPRTQHRVVAGAASWPVAGALACVAADALVRAAAAVEESYLPGHCYNNNNKYTIINSLTFPWQCAALMPMLSGTHSIPVVLVLM